VATRLLCAGDIHIGRQPSGLTPEAKEQVDESALSPAAVWHQVVDLAIDLRVEAVLLAGDVVEQRDDVYEALGILRSGVKRLVDAGIEVIGVAGNHDGVVLPRLVEAIPDFRLLGRGGTWDSCTVQSENGPDTRILGWSFPDEHVASDPLVGLPRGGDDRPLTIGLLHCDLGASGSRYAPVRASALADAEVDAWLLGHIHKPDSLEGPRPIGYLGALTALDPSDEGARGPWLLEIENDRSLQVRQLHLAPLRFEPISIDVAELDDAEGLPRLVTEAVESLHERLRSAEYAPRAVGLRIRLEGRTALRPAIGARSLRLPELVLPHEGIDYFVQKVTNATRPARDLAEIAAGGNDPYSLLAARLRLLDRDAGDPDRRALVGRARAAVDAARGRQEYTRLEPGRRSDDAVVELLRDAGLAAMDALELQREEAS